jgi:hypothetical protein
MWFYTSSYYRSRWFGILLLSILIIVGCEGLQESSFIKQRLTPPAKVVLFNIEGSEGKEFTNKLATALNECGIKEIIHGSQYGQPADFLTAAKIAREMDSRFFIVGEIARSEIIEVGEYTIHGNFSVHESVNGNQIAGVMDAQCTENLALVNSTKYKTSRLIYETLGGEKKYPEKAKELSGELEKIKKEVDAETPQVRVKLAKKVAKNLVQIMTGYQVNK